MARSRRLIIGLGNPGPEYEHTRHNIGFTVVDVLSERTRTPIDSALVHARVGWGKWRGFTFGVAKPITYMNRSGLAVRDLVRKFELELNELFVIFDDINLPVGALRIRQRGSAGGHNGLQDIVDTVGSDDIPRLRIGIGSDFGRGQQADYVLSRFSEEEKKVMDETVKLASEAALTFVTEGIVTAMNRYNRKG